MGEPTVYYVDSLELALKTGIREIETDEAAAPWIVIVISLTRNLIRTSRTN
ncbi:MAG: hypothetical protein RMJ00_02475 [Nitrososphaerota archaeon]|nr:hypothetical protein [Candidatus Bathyarchaeota archaeon]MDW8061546.1 hypothetical protein [Nitrososphaerota archaeon]